MHDHDHSEQKHIVPTEEMLSDLAELYKILGTAPVSKFYTHCLKMKKEWGTLPNNLA